MKTEKQNTPEPITGSHADMTENMATLCKALGHPARIAILRHLIAVDKCICGEIVEVMPLAQSTVSQHLKILKEAGLVLGEVEGPKICYCADRDTLARFQKMTTQLMEGT